MKLRTLSSSLRTAPGPTLRTISSSSWRAGKTTAERGYGYRWQKAREQFLISNPLCVFCARQGYVECATVVDHITPHNGDQKLFWDRKNWQALCAPCHDGEKKRIENGSTTQAIGLDGWPVDQPEAPSEITADYLRERAAERKARGGQF